MTSTPTLYAFRFIEVEVYSTLTSIKVEFSLLIHSGHYHIDLNIKSNMSYIQDLVGRVDQLFNQAIEPDELRKKVIILVQSVAKESFKNGCETVRSKYDNSKGRSTK